MYCTNCGHKFGPGENYCIMCGAPSLYETEKVAGNIHHEAVSRRVSAGADVKAFSKLKICYIVISLLSLVQCVIMYISYKNDGVFEAITALDDFATKESIMLYLFASMVFIILLIPLGLYAASFISSLFAVFQADIKHNKLVFQRLAVSTLLTGVAYLFFVYLVSSLFSDGNVLLLGEPASDAYAVLFFQIAVSVGILMACNMASRLNNTVVQLHKEYRVYWHDNMARWQFSFSAAAFYVQTSLFLLLGVVVYRNLALTNSVNKDAIGFLAAIFLLAVLCFLIAATFKTTAQVTYSYGTSVTSMGVQTTALVVSLIFYLVYILLFNENGLNLKGFLFSIIVLFTPIVAANILGRSADNKAYIVYSGVAKSERIKTADGGYDHGGYLVRNEKSDTDKNGFIISKNGESFSSDSILKSSFNASQNTETPPIATVECGLCGYKVPRGTICCPQCGTFINSLDVTAGENCANTNER